MKRISVLYTVLFCVGFGAFAQTKPNEPPFALTLEQARNWKPSSEFAFEKNVSTVPVARRVDAILDAQSPKLDTSAKVLYAPDGMNNFANYLETQNRFNLYNFTHWAQIDVLNWFAGTADHTVQIPSKPWVDVAHKNGVKVIGSVFLAIARWGGNPDTVEAFLEQDEEGRFIFAHRLVEIASYYGFDGWLMNQETDLRAVKDASNALVVGESDPERAARLGELMLEFMQYFTAIAPAHMEIHWYDSMLRNGAVKWQNELNQNNAVFLQDKVRTADAMFINYWWNESMVKASLEQVHKLNRSPFDVYFGVDLWPSRNAQRAFSKTDWLSWLVDAESKKARFSIALFAPNFNYNFTGESHTPAFSLFAQNPEDYQGFYDAEQRLFSGDDLNSARTDITAWAGLDGYLAAKSVINILPLKTHFNTGQGKAWFKQGQRESGEWTNMSKQDLLPTWQFAVMDEDNNSTVRAKYDFEQAYEGGSSLHIGGDSTSSEIRIPLFHTELASAAVRRLEVVAKGNVKQLSIYLHTASGQQYVFDLADLKPTDESRLWQHFQQDIELASDQLVTQIGLIIRPGKAELLDLNLGKMAVFP